MTGDPAVERPEVADTEMSEVTATASRTLSTQPVASNSLAVSGDPLASTPRTPADLGLRPGMKADEVARIVKQDLDQRRKQQQSFTAFTTGAICHTDSKAYNIDRTTPNTDQSTLDGLQLDRSCCELELLSAGHK